jgi:hypothetical protein
MGLGTSLILIAAGAILRFAVTVNTSGVNLKTVGLKPSRPEMPVSDEPRSY